MNTFNKKLLVSALAGVSVFGLAGAAQAVNVNPDGLGQVLIYPYYTVRESSDGAAFNSLLSVVNSTASGKAVKVRFLEGKNSREVLDFNLYLSKFDVWTAAIVPTADGTKLTTSDTSCTRPLDINNREFRNYAYTGQYIDFADSSLDRTREGYVEIIEMGTIDAATDTETAITHVNGVPPNCGHAALTSGADLVAPTGGLFGSITLVNPKAGLDIAVDPVALDAFSNVVNYQPTGSLFPNLGNAVPQTSVVPNGRYTYITDWSNKISRAGVSAVSAVLMHNNIYNEFVINGGAAANTDWVLTMPTKNQYFSSVPDTVNKKVDVLELFQSNFTENGSCDAMGVTLYDREERTHTAGEDVSPLPPTGVASLCWEANVMSFNQPILGSKNSYTITTQGYDNGWVGLNFSPIGGDFGGQAHQLVEDAIGDTLRYDVNTPLAAGAPSTALTTYVGLPVVGFAVQVFNNGYLETTSGKVNANYAGRLNHKSSRLINFTP